MNEFNDGTAATCAKCDDACVECSAAGNDHCTACANGYEETTTRSESITCILKDCDNKESGTNCVQISTNKNVCEVTALTCKCGATVIAAESSYCLTAGDDASVKIEGCGTLTNGIATIRCLCGTGLFTTQEGDHCNAVTDNDLGEVTPKCVLDTTCITVVTTDFCTVQMDGCACPGTAVPLNYGEFCYMVKPLG